MNSSFSMEFSKGMMVPIPSMANTTVLKKDGRLDTLVAAALSDIFTDFRFEKV